MTDCKHAEGDGHDCAYVDAVNALIPLAGMVATDETGIRSEQDARWVAAFHAAMTALCEERGLRQRAPRYSVAETRHALFRAVQRGAA